MNKKSNGFDVRFGQYALQVIGVIIFLTGLGFFFTYAIEQGWIDEKARVIAGFIAGSIFFGLGHYLTTRYKNWANGFVVGGIIVYHTSACFAHYAYGLTSNAQAFLLYAGTSLIGFWFAHQRNSRTVGIFTVLSSAIVSYIEVMDVPFLQKFDYPVFNLTYLEIFLYVCAICSVALGLKKDWMSILWINYLATFPVHFFAFRFAAEHEFIFYTIMFAVYALAPYISMVFLNKPDTRISLLILIAASSVNFFNTLFDRILSIFGVDLLGKMAQGQRFAYVPDWFAGLFEGAAQNVILNKLCIAFGTFFLILLALATLRVPQKIRLMATLAALSVGFYEYMWPFPLNAMRSAIFASIALLVGILQKSAYGRLLGYVCFGVGALFLLIPHRQFNPFDIRSWPKLSTVNIHLMFGAFIAFCFLAFYLLKNKKKQLIDIEQTYLSRYLPVCTAMLLWLWGRAIILWHRTETFLPAWLTHGEYFQQTDILLAAFYGVSTVTVLFYGLRIKDRLLRNFGAALTLFTLLKLNAIAMSTPDTRIRFVIFITVGILFIVGSLVYQRMSKET